MAPAPIRVFLSYRRGDSKQVSAPIGERLSSRFQLFMDIDTIRPGMNVSTVVRNAVGESDVLLAVIGPSWLTLLDESGRRRLDDPDDWVVEEVGEGLRRDIPVIPVLVDGARMPTRSELPPRLADLADRQAVKVDHESFGADSERLVQAIERMVPSAPPVRVQPRDVYTDPEYPAATAAFFRGDWPAAVELLERLVARHPGQRQLADRLTKARQTRLRIGELQDDVRALAAAGQWVALLAADGELAKLDPSATNVDGLADRARAELKETDLATHYAATGLLASAQRTVTDPTGPPRTPPRRSRWRDRRVLAAVVLVAVVVAGYLVGLGLTRADSERSGAGISASSSPNPSSPAPDTSSPRTPDASDVDPDFLPLSAPFAATSPWRLEIDGDKCWVILIDERGKQVGQYFELYGEATKGLIQVRVSGSFAYGIYEDDTCDVRPVAGSVTTQAPFEFPASRSDTAEFDTGRGIEVTGRLASDVNEPETERCWVAVRSAATGEVIAELEGDEGKPLLLTVPAKDQIVYLESRTHYCDLSVKPIS